MNFGWGSLVDLLKVAAGVGLAATGVGAAAAPALLPAAFIGPPAAAGMTGAALGATTAGASLGLGGAGGLANSASAPSDDEIRKAHAEQAKASMRRQYQYQPRDYSARPQQRQPQSGVDPEIMQYLMKHL